MSLRISLIIAAAFHFFGVLGMLSPWRDWFLLMTPFNMLLSVALLIWCQPKPIAQKTIWWALLATLTGYASEVIGVNTGLIFGNYQYGTTLGFGILNTPFLIGMIWLMTTFMLNEAVYRYAGRLPAAVCIALAAGLCTAFDWVIEPVAIDLGFWSWTGGIPPLQNYIGWFVVSALISAFYFWWVGRALRNPFSRYLLVMQVAFFVSLLLF